MRLSCIHGSFHSGAWLAGSLRATAVAVLRKLRESSRIFICLLCIGASLQVQAAPVQLSATFPASTAAPAVAAAGVDAIFTTSDGRVWRVISGSVSAGTLTQNVWLYDSGTSLMMVTVQNGQAITVKDISGSAAPADTQLPTVPTGLTATAASYTAINLSWVAATDNVLVTAYRIYRAGVWIGSATTTAYTDSNLTPATGYSYTLAACDAAGNCSPQSGAVLGTTQSPDDIRPSTPTNLAATATSTSAISLTWTASTDNVSVTRYMVYRDNAWVASPTVVGYSDTGLVPSTTYRYTVVACDAASNCSSAQPNPAPATTFAPPDSTAPTKPSGVEATSVGTKTVNLAWTASTDSVGVTGYMIYRDGVKVGSSTVPSFADSNLSPSSGYSYTVTACDAAGNCSGQSDLAKVTTLAEADALAPTVPVILSAEAIGPTQVTLSWTRSSDNVAVTGYKVYRSAGNLAGQTVSSVTTFTDSYAVSGTKYAYTVSACDAAGNCADSVAVSVTPSSDTQAPSMPFVVTATAVGATAVDLAWQPSVDNVAVTGYKVYRNGQLVGMPTATTYQDTGLIPSSSYAYNLVACDGAGHCSLQSATVTAITQANASPISVAADCLFNWAETKYPTLFAPRGPSSADGPNYWRSYSATGAYLWVNSDTLFYYGPASSSSTVDLGKTSVWYAAAGCN